MGVAAVELHVPDQKEAFSLRIVLADAILFCLRYAIAFIAILTISVVIGAVMYAMAKGAAFIISILLNLVCSI
jgi:hypothetical protein